MTEGNACTLSDPGRFISEPEEDAEAGSKRLTDEGRHIWQTVWLIAAFVAACVLGMALRYYDID